MLEEILRTEVSNMTYKTIVIDYAPKAKEMAAAIERAANERAQEGWELMTFSVTNSAKAILVFRLPNAAQQQGKPISEENDNETRLKRSGQSNTKSGGSIQRQWQWPCYRAKPWRTHWNHHRRHRSWHDVGRCCGALHWSGSRCATEKTENRGTNKR